MSWSRWPTTARPPGVLAQRLGLGDDVQAGIEQSYARWDGAACRLTWPGEQLALAARVSQVADACEVIQRTAGVDEAVEVVTGRSGTHFDPTIVAAMRTDPAGAVRRARRGHRRRAILDAEPVAADRH